MSMRLRRERRRSGSLSREKRIQMESAQRTVNVPKTSDSMNIAMSCPHDVSVRAPTSEPKPKPKRRDVAPARRQTTSAALALETTAGVLGEDSEERAPRLAAAGSPPSSQRLRSRAGRRSSRVVAVGGRSGGGRGRGRGRGRGSLDARAPGGVEFSTSAGGLSGPRGRDGERGQAGRAHAAGAWEPRASRPMPRPRTAPYGTRLGSLPAPAVYGLMRRLSRTLDTCLRDGSLGAPRTLCLAKWPPRPLLRPERTSVSASQTRGQRVRGPAHRRGQWSPSRHIRTVSTRTRPHRGGGRRVASAWDERRAYNAWVPQHQVFREPNSN